MRRNRFSIGFTATLAILAVTLFATGTCAAKEKQLHAFTGKDGWSPMAAVILDASGNLYGTTSGGANGAGTVFELTPNGGNWKGKVLHAFNFKDGNSSQAGVILDASGNLYGTTSLGGAYGDGTVFELTPKAGGGWKEKVLHAFNGKDGFYPRVGLIFDASGNLYGTTSLGGAYGDGTVFELTPKAGGGWKETVLHNFNKNGKDGAGPQATLIFDASGNLYSTTTVGGTYGDGTVFELTPKAGGSWKETVLHSFDGTDGYQPVASLIFDNAGNLYGTTAVGGTYGDGTVFELTPKAGGGWKETVLHSFDGQDGAGPQAALIFDASGNLYGTTFLGGTYGFGAVYELTPKGGSWTEKVLHSFAISGNSGPFPSADLIFDDSGNMYSTTTGGGRDGLGTVFEITP